MKTSIRRRLAAGKRRIEKRLDKANCQGCERPMLRAASTKSRALSRAANIQYELAEHTRGMTYGGIGSMLLLVRKLGLRTSPNSTSTPMPPVGPRLAHLRLPRGGAPCWSPPS